MLPASSAHGSSSFWSFASFSCKTGLSLLHLRIYANHGGDIGQVYVSAGLVPTDRKLIAWTSLAGVDVKGRSEAAKIIYTGR